MDVYECMLQCNGKTIATTVKVCASFWSKFKGLQFVFGFDDCAYVFVFSSVGRPFERSIHMFFVFFPIDVVWLDENKKVVSIAQQVKPFTPNVSPDAPSQYFVEMPAGFVQKYNIKKGEKIKWSTQ